MDENARALVRRHVLLCWWSLLAFLSLGIAMELLHALKIGWFLDVSNETRRLMWRLAHAHGTLLSLVHLAFALTLWLAPTRPAAWRRYASATLIGAGILLPLGFFAGGVTIYAGDPGLGIFLVPVGAALLFIAVLLTAWGTTAGEKPPRDDLPPGDASAAKENDGA